MAAAVAARAGAKWASPVYIGWNDGTTEMAGTISSTRNSADSVSRFGCYYERYTPTFGSGQYADCYAYDGIHSLSCGTSDPELTDTIARITGDTDVWILVNAGTCMRVVIGRSHMQIVNQRKAAHRCDLPIFAVRHEWSASTASAVPRYLTNGSRIESLHLSVDGNPDSCCAP